MTRNNKALLIAAVVVVASVAYFKFQEGDVKRRSNEKYASMIQISFDAAGSKNQQAVRVCEAEINTIMEQQFPEVARQGQKAAEDLATYGSCCKIVYTIAWDKIKHSNTTSDYVDERMQARLRDPLKKLSGDLETTLARFQLSLKETTVGLAGELAQMNPNANARSVSLPVNLKSNADINQALKNLGLNGTTLGISIPLDVWSVLSTKLVKSLVSKIASAAARLFAREAAEVATETVIASAGPETLGIADIIALVGAVWTAYDVYSTQKQFENEMKTSMDNMMPDVRRDLQKQIIDNVHSILKEHQRLQDEIRQQSVRELAT